MPEMEIDSVRASELGPCVLLSEKGGNRYLPIWIGPLEARSIAVKLARIPVGRPLTQDLLDSIISDLGGSVIHVIITHIVGDTFYAKIILNKEGHILEVDSRPSDALALALRAEVPIYVDESVLNKASFVPEPLH